MSRRKGSPLLPFALVGMLSLAAGRSLAPGAGWGGVAVGASLLAAAAASALFFSRRGAAGTPRRKASAVQDGLRREGGERGGGEGDGDSSDRIERLERERASLAAILEALPDPVIAVDAGGRLVFGNGPARKLFGRPSPGGMDDGAVDGRNDLGRTDPFGGATAAGALESGEVAALIARAIAERATATGAMSIGEAPGTTYQVTATPIVKEGRAAAAVAVFHDQTALRRLERIRSDFVANVSHELRTPLTAIHGFIETLQDGSYKDPERTLRYLGIMHAETTRLIALISDLLHLSKLEAPETVLSFETVDMVKLARDVVELFRGPAEAKGLSLDLEWAAGVPRVRADAALIRRALLNLVDNAIKYTEPEGKVRVVVTRDDVGARVSVVDTGVGIPPESLERVFERFYRVDKARSRKEGGTGLGLSIVKHTVESHKGKLGIESQLGQGTTIWFSLPAQQ